MAERVHAAAQGPWSLGVWSGESLSEALLCADDGLEHGAYWVMRGIAAEQVEQVMPSLRAALEARGVLLFAVDPLGVHATMRTFSEAIRAYVGEVSRRVGRREQIEELLEWLHMASRDELSAHDREVVVTDTLSRLWVALGAELPAVLLVFHPERLASQVTQQLEYLLRYYFTDPIAPLAPELSVLEHGWILASRGRWGRGWRGCASWTRRAVLRRWCGSM